MHNQPRNLCFCMRPTRLMGCAAVLVSVGFAVGCQQPWYAAGAMPATQAADLNSSVSPRADQTVQSEPTGSAVEQPPRQVPDDPFDLPKQASPDQQTLSALLAELQAMEGIDEATRQQILDDLQGADSAMLHHVRATLAYRRQLAQAQSAGAALSGIMEGAEERSGIEVLALATNGQAASDQSGVADDAIDGPPADAEDIGLVFASTDRGSLPGEAQLAALAREAEGAPTSLPMPEPGAAELPPEAEIPSTVQHAGALPQSRASETGVVAAIFEEPAKPAMLHALAGSDDWKQLLDQAIARLQEETATAPATSADIGTHARLRLLQLAADDQDAFRPIEGIPPNQQDFWAKQLFGLSTYLDDQTQPDVRRRASLAQHHFESAVYLLSEIAVLEVRNLTFCRSIRGYGLYEAETQPRFRAGDQVTLYAEVANYRSEQNPNGFRTMLASSYEVLDESDRRVDAGEFPQVDDLCGSRRRDFHIQYGVNLPTRIYPGRYRLQITVEDVLSRKLGRASVQFEIAEDTSHKR